MNIISTHRYSTDLDNYVPARDWAADKLEWTTDAHGRPTAILHGIDKLPDATKSLYLLDDGRTARIMYVSGWAKADHATQANQLWLQDIPVNPDGETRPDNGERIQYSTWRLGPRRTYHLKLTNA